MGSADSSWNGVRALAIRLGGQSKRRLYSVYLQEASIWARRCGHGETGKGFVMVEQAKSIDFRVREAKPVGKAQPTLFDEVLSILDACIW